MNEFAAAIWESFATYSAAGWVGFPYSTIAAGAWITTSTIAMYALFSEYIKDGVIERCALWGIVFGGYSRAFFILANEAVPVDSVLNSLAIAIYSVVIWRKWVNRKKARAARILAGEPERRTL